MHILLDIDGTLAQFTEALSKYLLDRGYEYPIEKFDTYALKDCLDPKHHWLLEAAPCNKQFCWSIPRYDGAQHFAKSIKAKGHKITLVTALWNGPHWAEARTAWIESFLSPKELKDTPWAFVTPEQRCELDADILIDDRPQTCQLWATKHDKKALLMHRHWNAKYDDLHKKVVRVHSYDKALEHL